MGQPLTFIFADFLASLLDWIHWILNQPPVWKDAEPCGIKRCKFCTQRKKP